MSVTAPTPTRLWRLAGALALAHVVLMLAGLALESTPGGVLGDRVADRTQAALRARERAPRG